MNMLMILTRFSNKYALIAILSVTGMLLVSTSCQQKIENPFWGDGAEFFEVQQIFASERFPNIVTSNKGTIIATWGRNSYQIRRSEDGGVTWGPVITVADPGFQGGGAIVDEQSGDILVFVEEQHPPSTLTIYRSSDDGISWKEESVSIHPDSKGNVPSMHMNERGITLQYGPRAGRLIRPSRSYGEGNNREYWSTHYTNAIYSDDGGRTWHTSEPFPAYGTGEATLAELSDGRIYYNSRRHLSTDGLNPKMRHIAWSNDGGENWVDMSVSDVLPDGSQHRDYGLMGGLVRLPIDDHDILIFSNIVSNDGRHGGTVWASFDGGSTWPVQRLVEEGSFAYSSMTAGRAGTPSEGYIFLFYESDGGGNVARFNLPWVTNGHDWRDFLTN